MEGGRENGGEELNEKVLKSRMDEAQKIWSVKKLS